MTEAAISRPTYASNQSAMMSPYTDHQPGTLACRTSATMPSCVLASVSPYRVSRSVTSRSLNRTRPFSIRLILDRDALISYPACSGEMPAVSRKRCNWMPSSMRGTVGPRPSAAAGLPSRSAVLILTPRADGLGSSARQRASHCVPVHCVPYGHRRAAATLATSVHTRHLITALRRRHDFVYEDLPVIT